MHDRQAVVIVPRPGPAQPATELEDCLARASAQVAANRARTEELQQRTKHVLTEAQAAQQASVQTRRQRRSSPAGWDLLQRSEYARLLALPETMPVIEQAKGIIMAQSHCGDAQAFDLLRQASQRSNVPVRELAAQIVANTVQVSSKPVKHLLGLDILMSPLGSPRYQLGKSALRTVVRPYAPGWSRTWGWPASLKSGRPTVRSCP